MLFAGPGTARAQSAGDTVIAFGPARVGVVDHSTSVHTRITPNAMTMAGTMPESFDSPDAALDPQAVTTLGLSFAHSLSDHLIVELDLGLPPRVSVMGRGETQAPGPAGTASRVDLGDPAFNPLGSQRQWSPALVLQYRFRAPSESWRPYLGIGFTYTWFNGARLNLRFERELDERYGQGLALAASRPGPTSASVTTKAVLAPVLAGGLAFATHDQWGLNLAFAAIPIETVSTLTLMAADGAPLSRTEAQLRGGGLVAALLVTRGF